MKERNLLFVFPYIHFTSLPPSHYMIKKRINSSTTYMYSDTDTMGSAIRKIPWLTGWHYPFHSMYESHIYKGSEVSLIMNVSIIYLIAIKSSYLLYVYKYKKEQKRVYIICFTSELISYHSFSLY